VVEAAAKERGDPHCSRVQVRKMGRRFDVMRALTELKQSGRANKEGPGRMLKSKIEIWS
jgi:hypothetical protein